MKTRLIVILSVLLLTACEQTNKDTRGQVVISSAFNFEDASVFGYNFELGKHTRYPSIGEPLPDIVVDQFRLIDGTVKPGFTSPANNNGFALAGEFNSLKESLAFYENKLDTFDVNADFSPSSDTVRAFQVWVLKTTLNKYVKLHVREVWTEDDAAGQYIEVMIDYYYQPDGTARFPD